jgi:hypothetical protein
MAYMCLTVLEASAGNRAEAAKRYHISRNVLSKMAVLASEVGDERTARKMPVPQNRPHTPAEVDWMEAVITAMIRRVGEWAFDPRQPRRILTMADFPTPESPAGP